MAINRLLAKQYGYMPSDLDVLLDHDWLCDQYHSDIFPLLMKPILPNVVDKARINALKEIFREKLPTFLNRLAPYVKSDKGFLFGEKLTLADFYIGGLYANYFNN